MNENTEISKDQFWKKILTIIIVGIVLVAAVYFGKQYKKSQKTAEITAFYNQFSEETYIDFAKKLEKSIHIENPQNFNEHIHLPSFFNFSADDLSKSAHKRLAIKTIKPYFDIGNMISQQLADPNDFKFNKFYKKDGVPHVVFRLYRADLVNFMDFTLGIKKDKIIITDMYVFFAGISFSEVASEMYYQAINNEQSFLAYIQLKEQIDAYVASENYEKAYNVLIYIPDERKNALYPQMLLNVAGNYDADKFLEVINYIKKQKPNDKGLHAYLKFQETLVFGSPDELNTAIENLKKYVGEDSIFDLYKGLVYNAKSNFKEATQHYDLVIKQDPNFFDAYFYKLFNLLQQDKTEEALKVITTMNKRFVISEEGLTFDLQDYKDFTASEAYKNIFKSAE
ncbi:hypothetical protein U8527_16640 [Kordia algicida OT-1]|uniref:Uncharacterized protein n=1 Tax=Kordia algicida OT-1 TaxID=391587 RepID=A9EAY2_9FLAO|nr:hypothetical protein [Kordia algicida]EDP94550.1 hypothetical protein KAOT1_10321 [Kordia algicida OT-1]